jgi:hypothetical protein
MSEYRMPVFSGRFRNMVNDPPEKTGRYCVGHAGSVFGDAYYTANDGDTHYPVGWSQVPKFNPEFWIDMNNVEMPRCGPRIGYSGDQK